MFLPLWGGRGRKVEPCLLWVNMKAFIPLSRNDFPNVSSLVGGKKS
jgi:hypothetical protein